MLLPHISPLRADYQATIIVGVSETIEDAAALDVTGAHESGFGWDYERCEKHGDGGDGLYGLGVGYLNHACGPPEEQAAWALHALRDKGWPSRPIRAFRGYLGAKSDLWPEAKARLSLMTLTAERIKCACCL